MLKNDGLMIYTGMSFSESKIRLNCVFLLLKYFCYFIKQDKGLKAFSSNLKARTMRL